MSFKDYYNEKIDFIVGEKTHDNSLDKRRIFTPNQKAHIWEKSKKLNDFDPSQFRLDMVNCLVSNLFTYNKTNTPNEYQRMLSLEYEHIIPHSECGATVSQNGALLNSFFNRSKGKQEMKNINQKTINGVLYKNGISHIKLREDLDNDPHKTCSDFDLYFYYDSCKKFWTIKEEKYNDQCKYKSANIRIRSEEEIAMLLAATVSVSYHIGKTTAYIVVEFAIEPSVSFIKDISAKYERRYLLKEEADKVVEEDKKKNQNYEKNKEFGCQIIGVLTAIGGAGLVIFKILARSP